MNRWWQRFLSAALLVTSSPATFTSAAEPAAAPTSPQPAVMLKPITALGKWMETQPFLWIGRIEYLRILNVHLDSPPAIAGIQDNMRILQIQGVDVRGLTETEFAQTLESMPAAATLTLVVDGGLTPRTIVFPVTRGASIPPATPSPPAPVIDTHAMSEAEIKNRLDELKNACDRESAITSRAFRAEYAQALNENRKPPPRSHTNPEFLTQARLLATELARQNVSLVLATAAKERGRSPLLADTLIAGLDEAATHNPAHKALSSNTYRSFRS